LLSLIRAGHAAVRDHARLLSRDGSSSRELVGPDITAAATLERYPRFIKGGFQDYERLGVKRSTASPSMFPPYGRGCQEQRLWSLLPRRSRIFAINTLRATPSIC